MSFDIMRLPFRDIHRHPAIKATFDHRTVQDKVVEKFQEIFPSNPWGLAIFDAADGLFLICRPDESGISVAHNILNLRCGFSRNGIIDVQHTAQAMAIMLNVNAELCTTAARSSRVVIHNIDTNQPSVEFW